MATFTNNGGGGGAPSALTGPSMSLSVSSSSSTTTTTGNVKPMYRPHNMERHFATHLLRTIFGDSSAHSGGAPNFPDDVREGGVSVGGREAVPFLTTSGVERDTLRAIWSAADPEGVGTLTRRAQFHVLLRLVAMCQAHLLPPSPSNLDDPTRELLDALAKYANLDVSLPTFGACPAPTTAFLISTYAVARKPAFEEEEEGGDEEWKRYGDVSSGTMAPNGGARAFAMATNADFQRRAWFEAQNRLATGGASGMTMGGYFGNRAGGEGSGRGGGGGTGTMMGTGTGGFGGMGGGGIKMSIDDAFADLPGAENRTLPSNGFGRFSEANNNGEDAGTGTGGVGNNEVESWVPPVQEMPLPPLTVEGCAPGQAVQQQQQLLPPMEPPPKPPTPPPRDDLAGAGMRSCGGEEGEFGRFGGGSGGDNDGFGTFGGGDGGASDPANAAAAASAAAAAAAAADKENFANFGDDSTTTVPHPPPAPTTFPTRPVAMCISDAFADMGPPPPLPPPEAATFAPSASLGIASGDGDENDDDEADHDDDADDDEEEGFGDFSDAPARFGGFDDNACPGDSASDGISASPAIQDDFGSFAGGGGGGGGAASAPPTAPAEVPPLPPASGGDVAAAAAAPCSYFGGFGSFGLAPDLGGFGSGVVGRLASVGDAFADIGGPLEDMPLPSLSVSSPALESDGAEGKGGSDGRGGGGGGNNDDDDDDDFGDFGDAEVAQEGGGAPGDDDGGGGGGDDSDDDDDDDDDFGDFGDAKVAQEGGGAPGDDGGGGGGDGNGNGNGNDVEDDDFGDFGDAKVAQEEGGEPGDDGGGGSGDDDDDDDDFGDFGEVEAAQEGGGAPGDGVEEGAHVDDDGFGDFGEAEAAKGGGDDDGFGHFGEAESVSLATDVAAREGGDGGGGVGFFGASGVEDAPAFSGGDVNGDGNENGMKRTSDVDDDDDDDDGGFGDFGDAKTGEEGGGFSSPGGRAAHASGGDGNFDVKAASPSDASRSRTPPPPGTAGGSDDWGRFSLPSPEKLVGYGTAEMAVTATPPDAGDMPPLPPLAAKNAYAATDGPEADIARDVARVGAGVDASTSFPSPDEVVGGADATAAVPSAVDGIKARSEASIVEASSHGESSLPASPFTDEAGYDAPEEGRSGEAMPASGVADAADDVATASTPSPPPPSSDIGSSAAAAVLDDPLSAFDALVEADLTKSGFAPVALLGLEALGAPPPLLTPAEPDVPIAVSEDEEDGGIGGNDDNHDDDDFGDFEGTSGVNGDNDKCVDKSSSAADADREADATPSVQDYADTSYLGPPPGNLEAGDEPNESVGEFGNFRTPFSPEGKKAVYPAMDVSDDFGDFAAFPSSVADGDGRVAPGQDAANDVPPAADPPFASDVPQDDFAADFENFDAPAPSASPGVSDADCAGLEADFGDFKKQPDSTARSAGLPAPYVDGSDFGADFGDFGGPEEEAQYSEQGGEMSVEKSPLDNSGAPLESTGVLDTDGASFDADFGDFGGFEGQVQHVDTGGELPNVVVEGLSSDERDVVLSPQTETSTDGRVANLSGMSAQTPPALPPTDFESDFGDFSDFDSSPNPDQGTSAPTKKEAPASGAEGSGVEEDFGDFGSSPAAPESEAQAATENGESFDVDFGDFGSFESPEPSAGDNAAVALDAIRRDLAALPALSKELRAKKQASNSGGRFRRRKSEEVSYLASFDRGVGAGDAAGADSGWLSIVDQMKTDPDGANIRLCRARRCLFLHKLLSSSHRQHGAYFERIVAVAKVELDAGLMILDQLSSSSFSRGEKVAIVDSDELQVFICGMGEYVRVVRFVLATLGDLLCMDEGMDLTEKTISLWGDIALLQGGLEVEGLWNSIHSSLSRISLAHSLPKVEALTEIRKRTATIDRKDEDLCSLTLQPLNQDLNDTRSAVKWGGHSYMACAANFWSNKVSSVSPVIL